MLQFVCSLSLCMLGNLSELTLTKLFQEHYQSVKDLDPDQGPDLDPSCFQRLSAED